MILNATVKTHSRNSTLPQNRHNLSRLWCFSTKLVSVFLLFGNHVLSYHSEEWRGVPIKYPSRKILGQ